MKVVVIHETKDPGTVFSGNPRGNNLYCTDNKYIHGLNKRFFGRSMPRQRIQGEFCEDPLAGDKHRAMNIQINFRNHSGGANQ
jgi:hypothetical protein